MPADSLKDFAIVERAPAKINLALHVVGQREDGYHLLDSLVTFTAFGDRIGVSPAAQDDFTLSGRFAPALSADAENLVTRARDRLRTLLQSSGHAPPPVHIHLEKNVPVASGIGGGSADAAATLRALLELWGMPAAASDIAAIAIGLGADVPMCLTSRPLVARGVGEDITPVAMPALSMVMANPLVGVSTPAVFKVLTSRHNPRFTLEPGDTDWLGIMRRLRNDLETPARTLCPEISAVAESLAATGAQLVRMTGSGATCFALYGSDREAEAAAAAVLENNPHWFVIATPTLGAGQGGTAHGTH